MKLFRAAMVVAIVMAFMAIQGPALAAEKAEEPIDKVKANAMALVKQAKGSINQISVADFKVIYDKQETFFELVDVRMPAEYQAGHIPGAMNISRNVLEFATPNKIKDPNVKIYIYCKVGGRGALAAKSLMDIGYTNVTNIDGGFAGWVKAGYPARSQHGEFYFKPDGFGKKMN